MATAAALLPLLRGASTSDAIRPPMLMRVMAVLRIQAMDNQPVQGDKPSPAATASNSSAPSSSSVTGGRAALLQLDAPAVLLHVMRTYAEEDDDAEEEQQTIAAKNNDDNQPLQPSNSQTSQRDEYQYLQVQLSCLDVLTLLASDAVARQAWVPRLALELVDALQRALHSYAAPNAPVNVELLTACLPLVNVLLSEKGSSALFAQQGAFMAHVGMALQDACAQAQALAGESVERLHSAGLTFLLLLLQHQLDQQELPMPVAASAASADPASSSPTSTPGANTTVLQLLRSRRMVETVFLRVGAALVAARSDATPQAQALQWKFCALAARYPQLFQDSALTDASAGAAASSAVQSASDSDSQIASDPLRDHAAALATSIVELLAGSAAAQHAHAAWETQALSALHTLCGAYPREAAGSLSTEEGCTALLQLMRTRSGQVDVQQGALRVLHALLRLGQRDNKLSDALGDLSIAPSALSSSSAVSAAAVAAPASSSNQSGNKGDASPSQFSRLLLQQGALPLLISAVESSLTAATRTHVEADAWLDVQSMSLYAFATLFLADAAQPGEDGVAKGHPDGALEAAERMCPLALRCLRALAQSAACSSSDVRVAGPNGAPSLTASAHQAVSSALFVLAGDRSSADRLLASGAVQAALQCTEECVAEGLDDLGEAVARPCLVLLLRLGAHATPERAAPVFAPCAPDAIRALQPLFDSLPDSSSVGDVLADALLMLQGKAPPPPQYRS